MQLVNQVNSTMPAPTTNKQEESGLDPSPVLDPAPEQKVAESDMDCEDKPSSCPSLPDNIQEEVSSTITQDTEILEVEHQPADSEIDEDEENYDWSPAFSEANSDAYDGPIPEGINEIAIVLENVIRSNLSREVSQDGDYLDLDVSKYETVLLEVRSVEVDSIDGESMDFDDFL